MAFTVTQERPGTRGEAFWYLKEKLVTAGATVKSSSDGTTFGAGDNLEPGGPYVSSLETALSWFVIQFPAVGGVVREVLFQMPAATTRVTFRYSAGAGFTGGGATTVPTATDEHWLTDLQQVIVNSADQQTGLGLRPNYIIGDASEGYTWLLELHYEAELTHYSVFFMDVVEQPSVGDGDPCVLGGLPTSNYDGSRHIFSGGAETTSGNMSGWYQKGQPGEAWVAYPLVASGYVDGFSGTSEEWHKETTQGPDGNFLEQRAWYARFYNKFSTQLGWKGLSRIFGLTSYLATQSVQLTRRDGTRAALHGITRPWAQGLVDEL